jgi:hypothetical protein
VREIQDLLAPPALPLCRGKCLFWRAILASPPGPPLGASGISSPSEPYRSVPPLTGYRAISSQLPVRHTNLHSP